jgi:hypothetical protein
VRGELGCQDTTVSFSKSHFPCSGKMAACSDGWHPPPWLPQWKVSTSFPGVLGNAQVMSHWSGLDHLWNSNRGQATRVQTELIRMVLLWSCKLGSVPPEPPGKTVGGNCSFNRQPQILVVHDRECLLLSPPWAGWRLCPRLDFSGVVSLYGSVPPLLFLGPADQPGMAPLWQKRSHTQ